MDLALVSKLDADVAGETLSVKVPWNIVQFTVS